MSTGIIPPNKPEATSVSILKPHNIRVMTDAKGHIFFIGADICRAMGIDASAASRMSGLDKLSVSLDTYGAGIQVFTALSEAAVYSLILFSRKQSVAKARKFLIDLLVHQREFSFEELFCLLPGSSNDTRRTKQKIKRLRRRARLAKAIGDFTNEDMNTIRIAQNNRCYYCNKGLDEDLTIEHVIPLSRGGANSPDNIVLACRSCNCSKGTKLPHEWQKGGRLL